MKRKETVMNQKELDLDNIKKILENLSHQKNHLFISELHFQIALIIEAMRSFQDYDFYPEYVMDKDRKNHYDLFVQAKNDKVLFEFKYLTDERNRNPKRKYDCWKDIERIEECTRSGDADYGYFILLTNSPYYWNESKKETCSQEFSICEGRHSHEKKSWKEGTSDSTKNRRENPISIKNDYDFRYEDFSNGFKSLIVSIQKC